jgi:hypothetical protein
MVGSELGADSQQRSEAIVGRVTSVIAKQVLPVRFAEVETSLQVRAENPAPGHLSC